MLTEENKALARRFTEEIRNKVAGIWSKCNDLALNIETLPDPSIHAMARRTSCWLDQNSKSKYADAIIYATTNYWYIRKTVKLLVGAGAVWVTNSTDRTISRIDLKTNNVVATIPIGWEPNGVAAERGVVWVTSADNGIVLKIDPQTNQVIGKPIRVGSGPLFLAIGEGAVWVTNRFSETLSRIDLSASP